MKAAIALSVFLLLTVTSTFAWDYRLPSDCVYGIENPSTCCSGVPDAWYAHLRNPADCGTFYQCKGGVPQLMPCPEGLHWNVARDLCDWPKNAHCNTKPV